jgi:hypothetical protein
MLDVILPWRFYVGECLRHCYLPLWNPYQSAGYPIHADLQCPSWYPETILIGSTFGYSNITLHILFTLYIFIAGVGIFRLTKYFGVENLPAFISGTAFMLSGIYVAHAQHLFIIVSLAWIPWAILYYMKMSEDPQNLRNILILTLFTFLLVSGGYQALSIVMVYLFIVFFLFYSIRTVSKKDHTSFIRIMKANVIWALLTTGLCLVIISSETGIFKYVERLSGMSLDQAQSIPFTPRSLVSLLVPFGVVKNMDFFRTDISMTNLYMGIFMLGFFLAGIFMKLKPELKILLIFSLVFLLASFGNYLPVRKWLYNYFPLMDLFRLPGFLRVLIVIPITVTGGIVIDALLKGKGKLQKWIPRSFILTGSSLIILLIYSTLKILKEEPASGVHGLSLSERLASGSMFTHILIQSIIQIVFVTLFLILFYVKKVRLNILIPVFVMMDMFTAVQLNIKYTGCSPDFDPLLIRADLKDMPRGFPLPPARNITDNKDAGAGFKPFWRNTNIFSKTVSFDAFTSFKLKGYKFLEDEAPRLKEAILNNHLVYISDRIFNEDEKLIDQQETFHPKDLFLRGKDFMTLDRKNILYTPGDTVFLTWFSPNEIRAHTKTQQSQVITLLQSNYQGWKVSIDGRQVPHYTSNHLFISAQVPSGEHEIIFRYAHPLTSVAFFVSYSIFLAILIILLWGYVGRNHKKPSKIMTLVISLIVFILVLIFMLNHHRRNLPGRIYLKYAKAAIDFNKIHNNNVENVFLVDHPALLEKIMAKSGDQIQYRTHDPFSSLMGSRLWNDLNKNKPDHLLFARINAGSKPETGNLLDELYPEIREIHSTGISTLMQTGDGRMQTDKYLFSVHTDFETIDNKWRGNKMYLDTTNSFSGNFSNRLDSINKFSYSLEIPCSEISGPGISLINISAMVNIPDEVNAFIVLHIIRDDKTTGYYTLNLKEAVNERNAWSKVFFSRYVRITNDCKDKISIYVWNNSKGIMWVDDMDVKVRKK